MRTAIVADTNSGITPEEAAERGITLIPMPFLIDGAEYREGEDCTQPFFFERLAAGAEVATSQPSPGGITERWDRLLEDHDAILAPVAPTTAYPLGQKAQNPVEVYMGDVYTVPVNIAGLPALSLPCGKDSNGLPIGMQMIGKPFGEAALYRAGYAFE